MTTEEKAKRYDEAIKVIKGNLDTLNEITETGVELVNIQSIKNCFYRAFPELRESKDERIRKAIIGYIDHDQHYGVSKMDDSELLLLVRSLSGVHFREDNHNWITIREDVLMQVIEEIIKAQKGE